MQDIINEVRISNLSTKSLCRRRAEIDKVFIKHYKTGKYIGKVNSSFDKVRDEAVITQIITGDDYRRYLLKSGKKSWSGTYVSPSAKNSGKESSDSDDNSQKQGDKPLLKRYYVYYKTDNDVVGTAEELEGGGLAINIGDTFAGIFNDFEGWNQGRGYALKRKFNYEV